MFNLATLTHRGRLTDCSAFSLTVNGPQLAPHDAHSIPKVQETVGGGRDECAGGFCCDSADNASAFTSLLLNVKVITGPWFLRLVEGCSASWVSHWWNNCMCAASPSSSPGFTEYEATRDPAELPRLLSRFAKFINWKVAGQTANARCFTTRMTLLKDSLLGFLQIKTQFEPPIIILTLFKTSVLWVFLQQKKAAEETWSSAVSPPAVLTLAVP